MSFSLLVPAAFAAEPEVSWGCFGTGDAVGYLLVALMLALLLFLRVHRGERVRRPARSAPRPAPRSLDELGRALFAVIADRDGTAYRNLFLLGPEVQAALGQGADAYIQAREPGMFEASLSKIAARVPEGSTFDQARVVGSDALALRLQTITGSPSTVIVGTVVQVGGIYRMVHPGFVDQPTPRQGARPGRRAAGR
jgi:hypothetical protein